MATQSIDLKVQTGSAQADTDSVADALDGLGDAASGAEKELADLATTLNSFLTARAKVAGKTPKLLNLSEDKKALEELRRQFQEVINLNPTLRGPIGVANGVNRPSIPSHVNLPGVSASQAGQAQFMEKMLTRLLSHHLSSSQNPIRTGLTAEELTGRPSRNPSHEPSEPNDPRRPMQPDTPVSRGAKVLGYTAQQLAPLSGGAGQAVGNAVSMGVEGMAGRGVGGAIAGAGMGGMAAGGLAALLGYGVFKGASALNDGVDENKVEATDIDKFRRSLGGTSESFDKLREQSRLIGDAFNLTYTESRKLSTQFANIAKSNVGAADQAGEGVGLAQAVGLDESQGSGFMASLRHDGSIGEKKSDARLMATQFAEALKRTGSTLNAGDLMGAIQGFSSDASHRSLTAPNIEGFAGVLSAMVGSKTPGLDVGNSARILGQADASFQSGGGMGEASNTLQYMAMGGDKLGLLGVKARQAAGMFASDSSTFGDKDGAINKYMRGQGADDYTGHTSKESGLKQVMNQFDASGASAETKLLGVSNHFKLAPQQAAALYNLRDEGKLDGMMQLSEKHKGIMDLGKMSSAGYMAAADIGAANGDMGKLNEIKTGFGARAKLTDDQKTQLKDMEGIKDPGKLEEALVKFAGSLERERTQGEEIAKNAADTAKAANRMADNLIGPTIDSRNFLAALVTKLAPDTAEGKKLQEQARVTGVNRIADKAESGAMSKDDVSSWNTRFDAQARSAQNIKDPKLKDDALQKVESMRLERLGSKATPATLERMAGGPGKSTVGFTVADEAIRQKNADAINAKRDAHKAGLASPETKAKIQDAESEKTGHRTVPSGGDPRAVNKPSLDSAPGVVTPEMREKMLANDAKLAKINPAWEPGTTERQIKAESNFDANAKSQKGAQGYTQIMPATRKLFEGREGRKFTPGNFDDDLELHRLHMTDDLKREGNVPDALRAYNGGPGFRKLNSKENQEYGGKVLGGSENPQAKADVKAERLARSPMEIPDGNPLAKAESKAEAQKVSMQISPMNWSANINLMHEYGGREQTQIASASGVTKPRATGVLA